MRESRSKNQPARVRPFTAVLGMCALAATLLLWTKLRLVNGIPRTAVAEPLPALTPEPRPEPTPAPSPEIASSGASSPNAERAALPKGDAPPSQNEDWSRRDRIPPFE
ncbi:MAG: hypothetical protein IT434_15155 [Phycisphaerales bacterium]|nr:hypothetical protein [Phycisphaerales bacterium]